MPQIERIKEELGWFKVVFGILVAMDASIAAWIVQNYSTANPVLLTLAVVAMFALVLAVVWVNRRVFDRLDQLEKL